MGDIGQHEKLIWIMCQSCGIHEAVGKASEVSSADKIAKAKELGWNFVPKMKCNNCIYYGIN